jgi:hypothetical protein
MFRRGVAVDEAWAGDRLVKQPGGRFPAKAG